MIFQLSEQDWIRIENWSKDVFKKAYHMQMERNKNNPEMLSTLHTFASEEYPYYGAVGGGLSYIFTPTGLGTIITVKERVTGEELDLTDYDSW